MQIVDNIDQVIITAENAVVGQVYVIIGTDNVLLATNVGFISLRAGLVVTLAPGKRLVHKQRAELALQGVGDKPVL